MAKKKLHRIKDVKQLREVTRLLELENEQLHGRLQKLSRRVDELEGNDAKTLQLEIQRLRRALDGERSKHNARPAGLAPSSRSFRQRPSSSS